MQKIRVYLAPLFMAVVVSGTAMAQSAHDAVAGHDANAMTKTGHDVNLAQSDRFELASADGKYKIGLRGLLQQHNGVSYNLGSKKTNIDIELKRARVSLYGSVLDPRVTFLVQTALEKEPSDMVSGYRAPGTDYLSDYYLNLAFHHNYFQTKIGKFGIPWSRQQLTPAALTQFSDIHDPLKRRFSITNTGKDVGIMLHNSAHFPFEWALAGVSNGVAARVGFNHQGIDGYDFTDWHGGDIRFGFAANGFAHTDYKSTKFDDLRGGADFIAKVSHFSTNGAFYYQYDKTKPTLQHHFGTGLDAGYLIANHFEPVVRHSWLFENQASHQQQILGGLNYYIHNHNLKVQGYGGVDVVGKQVARALGGIQIQLAI